MTFSVTSYALHPFLKKGYKPDLTLAECALNRSNIGIRNAAVFPEPNGTDYINDLAKTMPE